MDNHLQHIRKELKKNGYTECAIAEVLKWYQLSNPRCPANLKQDSLGILRWRDISVDVITANQLVKGHRPGARIGKLPSLYKKALKNDK